MQKIILTTDENSLTVKCIVDEVMKKNIYLKEFNPENITQFGVGNFTNFSKLCKEVFDEKNDTPHKLTFENNTTDNTLVINISYLSIFEFRFDLILPLVDTQMISNTFDNILGSNNMISTQALIINDINTLKLTISSVVQEMKDIKEKKAESINFNTEKIIKELGELKSVVSLICNDIKSLEKFVHTELNEIKIVENDNNEKLSVDCKNLSINLTDCLCCTVNKFTPYGSETHYTISMDPKFKLTENFKTVKCKELSINIGTQIDGFKLDTLPVSVEHLIVQSNCEQTNFMFLTTANLPNLKIFHIKNICKSSNFDLAIQNLNPSMVYTTNSDMFLKEINLNQHGYQFKEEIKPDSYKLMNTFIYVKTINN